MSIWLHHLSCLFGIQGNLSFKLIKRGKAFFIAQVVYEIHLQVLSIPVDSAIQGVHFKQQFTATNGGSFSKIGYAGIAFAGGYMRCPDGKHTPQRWAVFSKCHICGGKSELAADLLAVYHPPADSIRPA